RASIHCFSSVCLSFLPIPPPPDIYTLSLHDALPIFACYQAGIAVVITLSAVYATEAMGFGMRETMLLVFLVNIAAAAGAFGFGYLQDRIGHRRALTLTLLGWIVMVLVAVSARSVPVFWSRSEEHTSELQSR